MEERYLELIRKYPFLQTIVKNIERIGQIDKRHWDNSIEEDFTKCLQVLEILKENKLL